MSRINDIDLFFYIKALGTGIKIGCAQNAYAETPSLHEMDLDTQKKTLLAMRYCEAAIPDMAVNAGAHLMFDTPISDDDLLNDHFYYAKSSMHYARLSHIVDRARGVENDPDLLGELPEDTVPMVLACARYVNYSIRASIAHSRMQDPTVRRILRDAALYWLERSVFGVPWSEIIDKPNDGSYPCQYIREIVIFGVQFLADVHCPTRDMYEDAPLLGIQHIVYSPPANNP